MAVFKYTDKQKNIDGTYDTYYPETSEDQIIIDPLNISLQENGFRKEPNGLMLQWGKVSGTMNGVSLVLEETVDFPTAIFVVTANITAIDNGTLGQIELFNCQPVVISKSKINLRTRRLDGATYYGPITVQYMALGH